MALTQHVFDRNGDVFLLFCTVEGSEKVDIQSGSEEVTEREDRAAESEDGIEFHKPASDQTTKTKSAQSDSLEYTISMRVSSKHMALASEVFRAMLQPNTFKEGTELATSATAEISLPDDDPDAFLILLNIIHGQTRDIPRKVELLLLSKIAVLVDKYRLHKAVIFFSDTWVDAITSELQVCHDIDHLYHWIHVSYVFSREDEFNTATSYAIARSTASFGGVGMPLLPIPACILEDIKTYRLRDISAIYQILHSSIEGLQGPENRCQRRDSGLRADCDAMTLGSILRGCKALGLYQSPDPTYPQQTREFVMNQMNALEYRGLCDQANRPSVQESDYRGPTHGLRENNDEKLDAIRAKFGGLFLKDSRQARMKNSI
ncbi:hypothetical protein B0O99DRAFT_684479 [Bisporella sp. PMI_857]|nr:hypothetical protein B0O99DRAFT_684479 [Bisporella sp. PMI_857]